MKHIEVHYHFVREQIPSIFTKAVEMDKLQHFSKMLGLMHLDMLHLKARSTGLQTDKEESEGNERVQEPAKGKRRAQQEAKSTKDFETFKKCGSVKDKTNRKKKARTKTWSDVVEGLKEEEFETTNSDKRGNELRTIDSTEDFDSGESNHMEAKRTRGQRKFTPCWRN